MKVFILMGERWGDNQSIVAVFDSQEKAIRAMYFYTEDDYDDMWIEEMQVQ